MSYFYLSQPYNGTPAQKTQRYEMGAKVCLKLLAQNIMVFSPIVHNHSLLQLGEDLTVEQRRDIFLPFDLVMLKQAKGMIVLELDGWTDSYGMRLELDFCAKHNLPCHHFSVEQILEPATVVF